MLLALGAASCGGDDSDSDSTAVETTAQNGDSTTASGGKEGAKGEKGSGDGNKSGYGNRNGGSDSSSGSGGDGNGGSAAKQHNDRGGGSAQFRVKGGDNSIQEFGEEGDEEEFDEAAAAVHGFLDARVRGDWKAACSYLAADVAESIKQLTGNSKELQGADCAGILEAISEGAPQEAFRAAAVADVGSLRIEDGRAFVLYYGAQGATYAIPMKQEDGRWKVASLAGTPIS